jgi:thymidylate synthase
LLIPVFSAEGADEAWQLASQALLTSPEAVEQDSRAGPTRELLHVVLRIENPQQRWIFSRQPALNPAFAIAEAFWVVLGRNDEALPVFFNPSFREFSGPGPTYLGAYGYRLRNAFGFDQLNRARSALIADSNSRQIVLQIWNSQADLPHEDGSATRGDIPCNLFGMLKVRGGKLHWTQVLRSNDLFRGVPHNIVQFTVLQEIVAGWLGVGMGPYTHLSDSLHIYTSDLKHFRSGPVGAVEFEAEALGLPFEESKEVLQRVEYVLNRLVSPDLKPAEFAKTTGFGDVPTSYANLLRICAADAARRRSWSEEMKAVAAECSNQGLGRLWQNWYDRVGLPRGSASWVGDDRRVV